MDIQELLACKGLFSGYGELRLHENTQQSIRVLDGHVISNATAELGGVSARVCMDGFWGMASSPEKTTESLKQMIKAAGDNAAFLADGARQSGTEFPSCLGTGHYDFHTKKTRLTQKDKLDFVMALDAYIEKKYAGLLSRSVALAGFNQKKSIITADGSQVSFFLPRTHVYISLTAEKDGTPIDLLPDRVGGLGEFEDFFSDPSLLYGNIDRQYENLMKKRDGVYAEGGVKECVLAPNLAGILAHEAVGHTVEADAVLSGSIASELLDQPVASELVSIVDFANTAMGELCPVPVYVDDEGVLAKDAVLIDKGVLRGYMHNKQSAATLGTQPDGNARGFAFNDEPLIRMRNTCILPGVSKLEDMIASVEDGYFLSHPTNGQADMTGEFMFGVSLGFEIKKGKLGRAILDTTVSGVAFDMLKTVTAVSDDVEWMSSGFCGKKQPASVGMGGPALRCKISVGGR